MVSNRRTILALSVLALALPAQAWAQQSAWDGTWVGRTAMGGDVSITIEGGSATQYVFRGENVSINSSGGSGKTFQLGVGQLNGTVTLTLAGKKKAKYSYSDVQGGTATASLTKQ